MKKIVLLAFVLVLLSTTMFVRFVRPVAAEGTVYIRSDGSIEGTDKIQREGNVYIFTDNIYDEIVVQKDNIVVDGEGYTLKGTGVINSVGIGLTGRTNVTIRNIEIREFYYGIGLWTSSNNTLSGNNITANNYCGICLYYESSYNNICGNNITNNQNGIRLIGSSNYNRICENNIAANDLDGITLSDSTHNSIFGNNITANERDGIGLYFSSSINSIRRNNITNNTYGIELYDSSNHNSISENNIANNNRSIWLFKSSFTSIYHNNFVNNTKRAATLSSVLNVWDDGYPSGGNYWSDYIATANDIYSGPFQNETGSDGIADTPYVIDSNNQDNYPLMGMFYDFRFWDVNIVISNSTIHQFSVGYHMNSTTGTWEKCIMFHVLGTEGTVGFCRVMIPRDFMESPYTVLVYNEKVNATKLSASNSTHAFLYFTYTHSGIVMIVPEFPTWTLMLLILIVLTVAIVIYKRRLLKTPIH
ncbi:MAG: right-handed parallel beta-helix repeat-containing protein [Candidatus Bathyarchaeota archaeon]|nr:right-handed parallel beta-helix repeat-containing protein [Candidatus Bathyarchaeota archaeon]